MTSLAASIIAACSVLAQADNQLESREKLEEAMGWILGTWEVAEISGSPVEAGRIYKFEWILDDAYIRWSVYEKNGDENTLQAIGLIAWKAESKDYGGWLFLPGGGAPSYGAAKLDAEGALVWKLPGNPGVEEKVAVKRTWKKIDANTWLDIWDPTNPDREDRKTTWTRQ